MWQAAAALEKLPIAAQIKGVSYAGLRGVEIVKVTTPSLWPFTLRRI